MEQQVQQVLSNSESQPEINHVPPHLLEKVWDLVEPGLRKVLEFDSEGRGPEDILKAMLEEREFMTLAFRGDDFMGFTVSWIERPYKWHVDLLYSEDNLLEAFPLLEDAARQEGASIMIFGSQRKGFKRLAKQLGFSEAYVSYRKDL